MDKILILGAGNAQIDLIRYCRESGMEVYCCSYTETDPGIRFADHFARIDIVDREKIESYFRDNRINMIYSVGSDIAVPVLSAVAENTQTPSFVSPESAEACCDKGRMRNLLKGKRFNPSFIIGSDPEAILKEAKDRMVWPAKIKPVDSQGQRGVARVDNPKEMRKCFQSAMNYSRKGEVILEEYIDGREVSLNAHLLDGEILCSVLTDREVWPEFPGGIIRRHHFPSRYENSDVHRKILDLVREAADVTGLSNGPIYAQIMIRDDSPYLIEVTPRLDGCHLWRLIREACGVDLLDMAMNHLRFGDPFRGRSTSGISFRIPDRSAYHLEFHCQATGEKVDSRAFCKKDALYRCMYYEDGEAVKPVNGFMEKCGYRIYEEK